jgi:hypothetical protein
MQAVAVLRTVLKTVRLDRRLRDRLRRAAKLTLRTESDLIRRAVERQCDEVLSGRAEDPLADLIGSVQGDGSGYSRRTSRAFGEILVRETRKRRRR